MSILDYFPEKEYYPYQKDTILNIFDSFNAGAEIVFCESPFGTGKSVIAKTLANYFKKSYILTASRGLQEQYTKKYPDIKEMSGSNNSPCLIEPKKTKAKAKCTIEKEQCEHKPKRIGDGFEYDFDNLCLYWQRKVDAISSHISVHNYDYLITELKFVGDFRYPRSNSTDLKDLSIGIFDEAHNIGMKILHHYDITLSSQFLLSCGIPFPVCDSNDKWVDWIDDLKKVQIPHQVKILEDLANDSKTHIVLREQIPDKIEKLDSLNARISVLLKHYATNKHMWLFTPKLFDDGSMNSLQVIPIIVSPFVEESLFQYFDKKLLLSSTILNPHIMINDLGLKGRKMNFIGVPCPFPLENRQIYPLNIGLFDYENQDRNLPRLTEAVKIIMDLFPDKKGLVHSNSFYLNNHVFDTLPHKYSDRIITHRGGTTSKSYINAIEEHLKSDKPSVLMTPSAIEGVDLPGKQSEFQICFKLSYDNFVDNPQLKVRKSIDPQFYEWNACVKEIQRTGRSIRSMTDIASTFHCDSRFNYFVNKNKDIIPKWWSAAIQPTPHKYSYIVEEVNKIC